MAEQEKPDVLDELIAGGLGEWFKGRKLEDLEIVELDGEALFPDVITRIDFGKRALVEQQVYMRVPQPFEQARARVDTLFWLAQESKRDPRSLNWDDAIKIFGAPYAQQCENIQILARSLRKRSKPEQQYMTADNLQKCHPAPALWDAFNRLSMWRNKTDLRLNEEQVKDDRRFWSLVGAVAKAGHCGPLAVTDGPGLEAFVLTTVSRLLESRTAPSSQPSAESSTSTAD